MKTVPVTCLLFLATVLPACAAAGEIVSARTYADSTGHLDEERAARFIIAHEGIPLAKILKPDESVLTSEALLKAAEYGLLELRLHAKHPNPPWTWREVNEAFDAEDDGTKASDENGNGWDTAYHWENKKTKTKGSAGPFSLRKNKDEAGKGNLAEARGATLGFANNRLKAGRGAWNSEGILLYPIEWSFSESKKFYITPAIEWKSAETEETGTDATDSKELTLATALRYYHHPDANSSALWVWEARPFFNTDFSWGHRIWGAELSTEYVGYAGSFYLGGFQDFAGTKNQYSLRIVPKIQASEVAEEGKHTKRKLDDDWLRVGALVSLDFRFVLNKKLLEVGTSYEFLQQTDRARDWSDRWNTHATWWLNPNVGLTLENVTGETPIADEAVDQLTLGLEVKF